MNYVGKSEDEIGKVYSIEGDTQACAVTICDYGNRISDSYPYNWGYSIQIYSPQTTPTKDMIEPFSDALTEKTRIMQGARIENDRLSVFTYKKPDLDVIEKLCLEHGFAKK